MRYWEGPPARAATGTPPFAEHRTMKEVRDAEVLVERLRTNMAYKRAELRKQLKPKDKDDGTRPADV